MEDNHKKSNNTSLIKNGRFVFANGDEYDGSYQLNNSGSIERHGQGVFKTQEGTIYSGHWMNDKMNGRGVFTHPSGCQYEGEFVDGYFEGHGKYTWPDGSVYEGDFKKSKLFGKGYFTDPTKQTWIGKFEGDITTKLKFKLNM